MAFDKQDHIDRLQKLQDKAEYFATGIALVINLVKQGEYDDTVPETKMSIVIMEDSLQEMERSMNLLVQDNE